MDLTNRCYQGIWYEIYNSNKNSKKIVLLHGLSSSSSVWKKYVKKLTREYSVMVVDLRGHGLSKRPGSLADYQMSKFADDLYPILKKENMKKVFLVGHSFSNFVAMEYAKKHPKQVEGLIFLSPQLNLRNMKKAIFLKYIILPLLFLPQLKKKGDSSYYGSLFKTKINFYLFFRNFFEAGIRSTVSTLIHTLNYSPEKALSKIKNRTLIIHGDSDAFFPLEDSIMLSKSMKNASLIVMKHKDHKLVTEGGEKVLNSIKDFVSK